MNLSYSEIATEDFYKPYIQKFWILNNMQHLLHTPSRYALPNGCCTIAVISGNGAVLNVAGKSIEMLAGVYLSGQITERASVSLKPFSKAIMAQVKPWLPPMITGSPMYEMVNSAVNVEFINHSFCQHFKDIDLSKDEDVIPAFYQALAACLHTDNDSHFIHWVYNRLKFNPSKTGNIASIAAASGYSQRRVEQKFKSLIGLRPKEVQRILQLRQLMDELITPGHNNNLTTLAHRYGYYDQSHFIRSYQRIILEVPSCFKVSDYILPLTVHFDFLQL